MSTDSTRRTTEGGDDDRPPSLPLAPDRPVVDGTSKTAAEIRAELAELLAEDRMRAEAELAELRNGVPPPPAPGAARPAGAARPGQPASASGTSSTAAARLQHSVERARTAVPQRAATLADSARQQPAVLAGIVALLLLAAILVVMIRRQRGGG